MKAARITLTAVCECGWTYANVIQSDVLEQVRHHRRSGHCTAVTS